MVVVMDVVFARQVGRVEVLVTVATRSHVFVRPSDHLELEKKWVFMSCQENTKDSMMNIPAN